MSLLTRLAHVEAAAAARAAAATDAALSELNSWTAAHWSISEQELWTRHLLNYPMPADFLEHLSMTRAEAEKIIADYAPLAPDEEPLLAAAWARVPPNLAARLAGTEPAAVAALDRAAAEAPLVVRVFDLGDPAAPAVAAGVRVRVVDYRKGLEPLMPADLAEVAQPEPVLLFAGYAPIEPTDCHAGVTIQEPAEVAEPEPLPAEGSATMFGYI